MDDYREFPSEFDLAGGPAAEPAPSHAEAVAAEIGTDERRMHVRAYNYWVSLLDGRDFPSIEDLEPSDVSDFSGHSVLLDFTCGQGNPAIPYIGGDIREECGLSDDMRTISDVPSRSLLSRLTDHYMQIIANRAPVGFEAEFLNQRGENICYRGILMPFSSDGDVIDFIYGVINWKKDDAPRVIAPALPPFLAGDDEELVDDILDLDDPVDLQPPAESIPEVPTLAIGGLAESDHPGWEDGPLGEDRLEEAAEVMAAAPLDPDAGLADRLCAARESADLAKAGEGRSRAALYDALALAYDFAVCAKADPDEYADLLDDSGLKAQARAPMTPIVKLIFGVDYDKARLTEFAAALSFADRSAIPLGGFSSFISLQSGGLKGLVAAERKARRPEGQVEDTGDAARSKLRSAGPIALDSLGDCGEFVVIVARRLDDGAYTPVAASADPALVDRAIRKIA